MPNLLATAFVSVKLVTAGISSDLRKQLDEGSAGAAASGEKAGKSWSEGFENSGIVKASDMVTEAIGAVAAESVVAAAKFDAAMTRISTQAGVPQAKLAALSKGILGMAGTVGQGPDELALSLYHVESNFASLGITGPKALNLVKIAAEGASVGGANLEDVTNALTAAVASGIPGVQNMSQAMGALNSIVGAGDMTMQNLADAFGTGMLATVKGFGVSLSDVGAALDVFGDNNIRGAKAGTDLRMAIQALASPGTGPVAVAALDKLGLSATTLAKDMQQGGLMKALDDLVQRMDNAGYTGDKVGGILTDAFGKRAGSGLNILVGQMGRLDSKFPALAKGANDFNAAWQQTSDTPAQRMKDIEAAAEALGVSLGNKLLPYVMDVTGWLVKNEDAVEKGAIGVAAFAVSVTALSLAIKGVTAIAGLVSGIGSFVTGIGAGITAMRSFTAAAMASGAVTKGQVAASLLAADAQKALAVSTLATGEAEATTAAAGTVFAVSTGGVTTAVEGLTVAERAAAVAGALLDATNPVGWAIAGAAAFAALAIVVMKTGTQTKSLVATLQTQDKATAYNVQGYDKLGEQLSGTALSQQKLNVVMGQAAGGTMAAYSGTNLYSGAQAKLMAESNQAFNTAAKITDQMRTLGNTYGITSSQALGVAKAAGIQATAWTGSAAAVDKANTKFAQYIISNQNALAPQQEENALIAIFGNNAFTASTQVAALNTSWQLLVGNFADSQQAISNAKSAIQAAGQAAQTPGGAGSTAGSTSFWSGFDQIGTVATSLAKGGSGAASMYTQLEALLIPLTKLPGLTAAESKALQGAQKFIDGVANSTHGMTQQQQSAVSELSGKFIPQLTDLGLTNKTATTDTDHLAEAIVNTGTKSAATQADRAQLIKDLEAAGLNAQTATRLVDLFIGEVGKIPKTANTNIGVTGSGQWSISENQISATTLHAEGVNVAANAPGTGPSAARGLLVSGGTPNRDSVLINAMPGELVVPKSMVSAGTVDHLRGSIPGFASGGVVGSLTGSTATGAGAFAGTQWNNTQQAVVNTTQAAMVSGINAAITAAKAAAANVSGNFAAGPGGGSASANAALAQKLYPAWASGPEWTAWNNVAMRESGWNQYAKNASSGAYGIPQALPPSKMGTAANPPQSNPTAQINWMIDYIKQTYKDPIGAWGSEQSRGWYARGTPGGGAAAGWGVVGEKGPELVNFHGGEHVLPHSMTGRILSGNMKMPGYASGTGTAKQQAAWLKELAGDVAKADTLSKSRSAAEKTKSNAVIVQELYALQHPNDKSAASKLKSMQSALSKWESTTLKPITLLDKEIALLRTLTGDPTGALYGGSTATSTSTSSTSTADSTSTTTTATAPTPPAPAASAFAPALSSAAGISVGGGPDSTFTGVGGGATFGAGLLTGGGSSPYQFGSSTPAASSSSGGEFAAALNAAIAPLLQQLQLLRGDVQSTPGQYTAGTAAVMNGIGTRARQGRRYRTR